MQDGSSNIADDRKQTVTGNAAAPNTQIPLHVRDETKRAKDMRWEATGYFYGGKEE